MTDKIVVLCTCSSAQEAETIARRLVEARLAACATILAGARSIYRWEGQIQDTAEAQLLIKSSRAMFEKLRAEIEKCHSYQVPELLALTVVEGSENYLNWMDAELGHE